MTNSEFIQAALTGYQNILVACLPVVFFIGACNMGINILLGAFFHGSLKIGGRSRA